MKKEILSLLYSKKMQHFNGKTNKKEYSGTWFREVYLPLSQIDLGMQLDIELQKSQHIESSVPQA